ncbi:MAG: LD-carboxypeptidase [Bacteroides sp.]|nr:LD-carboxypeptidase [Bacteroides sp.]MBD5307532.1 LD-carboxypeptidase [Bacteroides sp.]
MTSVSFSGSDEEPRERTVVPAPLRRGDLIALLAPASAVSADYCAGAARRLEEAGFRVRLYPSCGGVSGSYSAPEEQRRGELLDALDDEEVKGILCARGGYGCVQLLESLSPFRPEWRKWIIGFSDVSALHAWAQSCGMASLHAPMAKHLATYPFTDPSSRDWLAALTTGRQPEIEYPTSPFSRGGKARGRLIGGNLAVLNGLAATPFDILGLPLREPAILFLEDISEAVYAVERMLWRLKLQGVLEALKGLVIGQFTEYRPDRNFSSMEEMISTRLREWNIDIPTAFGFPTGHTEENRPLLLGAEAELIVGEELTTLKPA